MSEDDVRPVAKSIPGSADFWEPVQRHAAVLGNAVISWCELQEELGLLFGEVVSLEGDTAVARAAWHEVRSDRTQRHMLRAAIKASFSLAAKPLVKKHLLKALGKIDTMENSRNDAVHAPIQFVLESSGLVVIPMDDSGNPRAEAP